MHTKNYIFLIFIINSFFLFAQPKVKLDTFAIGYSAPIGIENDGFSSRVFIVQQNGIIWTLDSIGNKLDTFIDLRTKVQFNGEEGLLGVAFHPDYKNNGYFYTYYTKKNTTDNAVFRYKVTSNPNRANIDSQLLVISFSHPGQTNHNGGCIRFGKDGYLYIAVGDGGGGGDPNNNAQNKNSLLGKLLRLDMNNFNLAYSIPPTNPFVSQANVKQEIWAYGLRNPWRYSFDRETGDLWLADVGQSALEETNFHDFNSANGENYGWRCYEGKNTYNTSGCTGASNYKFPFFTYGRNTSNGGSSITGGFIYKGIKYQDLRGYYIFSDYLSGNFWLSKKTDTVFTTAQQASPFQKFISSYGEDIYGELYASNLGNGVIYKIRELCSPFQISLLKKKNPTCFNNQNGFIQLKTTGNNGIVDFAWSNGDEGNTIESLDRGTYVVRATDAIGCVRKDSFTLIKPDTLKIFYLQVVNPGCPSVANGQIEVLGSGGTKPYTYNWSIDGDSTIVSGLEAGKYYSYLYDSLNCRVVDSVILYNIETDLEKPIITQSHDTLYTTAGFSYQWYYYNFSGNGGIILDDTLQFTVMDTAGLYAVEIISTNGCKAISTYFRGFLTSIKNKNIDIQKFALYPNPANENLMVDIQFNSSKKSTLKIINSIGQIVYTEQIQVKDIQKNIPLQQYAKGMYLISIIMEDGQISSQTFVKE